MGDAKIQPEPERVWCHPQNTAAKLDRPRRFLRTCPSPCPTCLHYCSWDFGQRPRASVSHSTVTAPEVEVVVSSAQACWLPWPYTLSQMERQQGKALPRGAQLGVSVVSAVTPYLGALSLCDRPFVIYQRQILSGKA